MEICKLDLQFYMSCYWDWWLPHLGAPYQVTNQWIEQGDNHLYHMLHPMINLMKGYEFIKMYWFSWKKKLYQIIVSYHAPQVSYNFEFITQTWDNKMFLVMFSAVGWLCITIITDVSFCFWVLLGMYK